MSAVFDLMKDDMPPESLDMVLLPGNCPFTRTTGKSEIYCHTFDSLTSRISAGVPCLFSFGRDVDVHFVVHDDSDYYILPDWGAAGQYMNAYESGLSIKDAVSLVII